MSTGKSTLEQHLLEFFKQMAETKKKNNYDSENESFVFHMTDWKDDLKALHSLYETPSEFSREEAHEILQSFLFHSLPHVLAAAQIYDDAPEIYSMLMKSLEKQTKS